MINMPPRHGKSELASRRFPAWLLGANPRQTVISASYNMDKAEEFGGEVRDIVRSAEFQTLFPGVALKEDTRAKGFWRTDAGGYYIAAGVGTSITGRGTVGPIALIDDPLKDRAEADSERTREAVWAWYSSVILSRFPRAIIVVQTRWHEDDLSGRLLEQQKQGGDEWEVLELPAINPQGKALWPEYYPIEALERVRRATIPRDWSALYQQKPTPDDGAYFHRDWFHRYEPEDLPKALNVYGTSDYAVTDSAGDYTVHSLWGVDEKDHLWLLPAGWRGQKTTDVWIDQQLDLAKEHKPQAWFGESGVIQKAIEPFLNKRMQEKKTYLWMNWLPSIHDKPTRARGFQARAALKMVHVPVGQEGDDWIDEMIRFPTGKNDDRVDTASLIGRAIDEAHPAISLKPPPPRVSDYGFKRHRKGGRSWVGA